MEKFEELINSSKVDYSLFKDKGNKTAGTRLRKKMQQLIFLAKEMRNYVTDEKSLM